MPRKFLKRVLPKPEEIKKYDALKGLGDGINDPNLWHLNRRSAATAVAIGLFVAFMPIFGQMLIAAILALYLRGNIAISVIMVWVSNPITFPPMLYACYVVGSWLMGLAPEDAPHVVFTLEGIRQTFGLVWRPLLLGAMVLGMINSGVGYLLVRYTWRWHAIQNWKERRAKRLARNAASRGD